MASGVFVGRKSLAFAPVGCKRKRVPPDARPKLQNVPVVDYSFLSPVKRKRLESAHP